VSSALAVLALSVNGASAGTVNVPPVHVLVSPPPKNTPHGTTGINPKGRGSASPQYFQAGPTSETFKEVTSHGTTGINPKGRSSASPQYFQAGPTSETFKKVTPHGTTGIKVGASQTTSSGSRGLSAGKSSTLPPPFRVKQRFQTRVKNPTTVAPFLFE
jgi:hypothetical protein